MYIYIYIRIYMRKNVAERVGIAVTPFTRIREELRTPDIMLEVLRDPLQSLQANTI
jgi:hypothetical protein